jgi:hypothetical protein
MLGMARKGIKANRQVNIRFREVDLKNLEKCQQLLGGVSQADALRQLVLMYLRKMPAFPTGKSPKTTSLRTRTRSK